MMLAICSANTRCRRSTKFGDVLCQFRIDSLGIHARFVDKRWSVVWNSTERAFVQEVAAISLD